MDITIENLDNIDLSELSKSQRKKYKKLLKKRNKELARKEIERKKKITKIITYASFIGIAIVIVFIFMIRAENQKKFLLVAPSIEIIPGEIDLGTISAAAGPVEVVFTLKNTGKSELKINNIVTSCMCTAASFIINGRESPVFGMHGNSLSWTAKIPPGETAELKVVYDPNFHANTRGQVTRSVDFNTNDPQHKQMQVRIRINVVA